MMQRPNVSRRSLTGREVPVDQGLGVSLPVTPPPVLYEAWAVAQAAAAAQGVETPPCPPPSQFGDCPPELGGGSALSAQMLAVLSQMNAGVQALVSMMQARRPQGVVLEVVGTVTNVNYGKGLAFDPLLFSVVISNEGPNDVIYRMPNSAQGSDCVLHAGQFRVFSYPEGTLAGVGLRVLDATLPTAVRITGNY